MFAISFFFILLFNVIRNEIIYSAKTEIAQAGEITDHAKNKYLEIVKRKQEIKRKQ